MAPTAGFLAQSESKKRFFDRIGLDERNKLHRHLYSNMKAEAVEGWSRISANRNALIPQLQDDPTIEPPYTFGQIDEEAVHEEVMYIFSHARKDTKIMYQLGRDYDGDTEENWIIRWLLWHVFRYRDDRNVGAANRKRNAVDSEEPDAVSDTTSDIVPPTVAAQAAIAHVNNSASHRHPASSTPWIQQQLPQSPGDNASTTTVAAAPATRYFDPVRDLFRT